MNKQTVLLLTLGFLVLLVLPLSMAALVSAGSGSSGSVVVDGGDDGITVGPVYTDPCGNGVIDSGEQCDGNNLGGATCSIFYGDTYTGLPTCRDSSAGLNKCNLDYSSCTLQDSTTPGDGGGSSGGSSGGSGGGSSTCVENWTCSGWDECDNAIQTRTCSDSKNCGTTKVKPLTSRTCSIEGASGDEGIGLTTGDNTDNKYFGWLTGAAIGTMSGGSLALLIGFIILLIVLFVIIWIVKNNNSSKGKKDKDVKVVKNK